ncbi:MAG: 2-oxo-4-hydroxy-4-carboxy-5-ureidoimidazoline decarboxylase [Sphingobium sp.]
MIADNAIDCNASSLQTDFTTDSKGGDVGDDGKPVDLGVLNRSDRASFVEALAEITENSTWVQEAICDLRPFSSVHALWLAMTGAIAMAPEAVQRDMIRHHPELAGAEAQQGAMAANSTREQARLGLTAMSANDLARLNDLNARYRAKFGYPCIIALWRHDDMTSIFAAFEARLRNEPDAELCANLAEIGEVMRGRLHRLFTPADVS